MDYLLPPPPQETFEAELAEIFPHGDQRVFAHYFGCKPTYLSQMVNPDHTRVSTPYRFLKWLWAGDAMKSDKSDVALAMILRERGNWMSPIVPVLSETKHLTKQIGVQFSEFLDAELNDHSIDEQIKQCHDIVEAAQKKLDSLRQQKAIASFMGFGGARK